MTAAGGDPLSLSSRRKSSIAGAFFARIQMRSWIVAIVAVVLIGYVALQSNIASHALNSSLVSINTEALFDLPVLPSPHEQKASNIEKDVSASKQTVTRLETHQQQQQQPEEAAAKTPPKEEETKEKKPLNVLMIYGDDWRHDSLGCAGTQIVKTPFLDELASRGIRFTHNCVTTSICWISRATMVTGQYLARHKSGLPHTPYFYDTWQETAWPYLLQKHRDYFVGHVGKWQYSNYTWVQEHYNWTNLHEGYHWFKLAYYPQHRDKLPPNEKNIHTSDLAAFDAIDFLNQRPKDKPFALTVAFYPPKAIGDGDWDQFRPKNSSLKWYENDTLPPPRPDNEASLKRLPPFLQEDFNEARRRYKQRFGTPEQYQHNLKNYYRLITQVGQGCRRIYEELERQDLIDNTVIIFTTDHGFYHGEHQLSGKWFPHEESIRNPLIIQDPRMPKDKIGTTDDSFTLNIDLAETIMGVAGVEPGPYMQGRDISQLYLESVKDWRQEFFYDHEIPGHPTIPNCTALVRKDFKYIKWTAYHMEQLFHLTTDPQEERDLAKNPEYEKVLVEMRTRHDELKPTVL